MREVTLSVSFVEGWTHPKGRGSARVTWGRAPCLVLFLDPTGMGPQARSGLLSAVGWGGPAWLNWGGYSRRQGTVRRKGLLGTQAHRGIWVLSSFRRIARPRVAARRCDIHPQAVTSSPKLGSHVRGGKLVSFAMPAIRMFSTPLDWPLFPSLSSALILRLAGGEKPEAGNR